MALLLSYFRAVFNYAHFKQLINLNLGHLQFLLSVKYKLRQNPDNDITPLHKKSSQKETV